MAENKVHLLKDDVIGKISAGEVVERPASVVKELIENAIDAASNRIHIDIGDAGRSLIRVADNGEGMNAEDAELACLRHATSKLTDMNDLEKLLTLGFRGEALASIAAVSHLEITTSSEKGREAAYLYLEGARVCAKRPAARERGTTIAVKNLFYNVPARKKFLKKESTELAMIMDVVGYFVVSYPEIEFKLQHDGRELLHAPVNMRLPERIRLILGGDVAAGMMEVDFSSHGYKISGHISVPASTRKDKRSQMFFVNKRYVRSKILSDSLQDAYKSLLEKGRYPSCVLFLEANPAEIDVNIHPTKLLVKFDNEPALKGSISEGLRGMFDRYKNFSTVSMPQSDPEKKSFVPISIEGTEVQTEFKYDTAPIAPGTYQTLSSGIKAYAPEGVSGRRCNMFQVGDCYIVKVEKNEIMVTDQHAAHERILYEYFSRSARERSGSVQNLLFPARIDLSYSDSILMNKLTDNFKTLGFDIEHFGENSYIIQAVPAILKDRDIKNVVMDVLSDLSSHNLDKIDPVEEMIKYASCRGAIKAGDRLSDEEMMTLLNRLAECELPFTCPHGRPTSITITVDEFEKRFRRK